MTGFADLWPIPSAQGHPQIDAGLYWKRDVDAVYRERTFIVAALAHLIWTQKPAGWMAWLGRHVDQPGESWEDDWRWVVTIILPSATGEGRSAANAVTWHIRDSELALFADLPRNPSYEQFYRYDGHSTDEKYRRLYEYVTGRKQ